MTASIIISRPTDSRKMVDLARLRIMNTIDLLYAFKNSGDPIEVSSKLRECIRRYRCISAIGIPCELGSDAKGFERALDCPYTEG